MMLRGFPRVARWEDSSDVLQNTLLRLLGALQDVKPASLAAYFCLATLEIRRELIDLARHYFGPEGLGANQDTAPRENNAGSSPPRDELADTSNDPGKLALWTEFHQQVQALPEEERDVFELLWYQGLTQPEAVKVLGLSRSQIQVRWLNARRRLGKILLGTVS